MAVPPTTTDAGEPSGDSVLDSLKDKSLKTAGYAYLVGDAGLFASGMLGGRYKEASSGLLWGVGGLVCAKYANPDAEKQLELLGNRLSHYLHKQGVEIPDTPDTKTLTHKDGLIDHIEAFLHAYPSQILNATYAIGGALLLRSGMQHSKPWDAASGALVTAGALGGLLVQEKKIDPDNPPKGMFNKAKAWLQEKPLRIPGALYAMNNATLVMSALKERQVDPAQKSYMFKFLTAASYLFGNSMLAISSKSHHGEADANHQAMEKLATASAHVIAAQPPELQEALVQHIAGFLSSQPDVRMTANEISDMLHKKVQDVVRSSQPVSHWQSRVLSETGEPSAPSF